MGDMGNEEWRDVLAKAVGYRMHAINPDLPPVTARLQVRDFMKYGDASEYAGAVMLAAFELFGPLITAFAPLIRAFASTMIQSVEREVENGQAIEARRTAIAEGQ
jgi:hypothetical protein